MAEAAAEQKTREQTGRDLHELARSYLDRWDELQVTLEEPNYNVR